MATATIVVVAIIGGEVALVLFEFRSLRTGEVLGGEVGGTDTGVCTGGGVEIFIVDWPPPMKVFWLEEFNSGATPASPKLLFLTAAIIPDT